MPRSTSPRPVHLRSAGLSLLLDVAGPDLPRVVHWGDDLGPTSAQQLADLCVAATPQLVTNSPAGGCSLSLLPLQSRSWLGVQCAQGHRDGTDFSLRPMLTDVQVEQRERGGSVVATATDSDAAITFRIELNLDAHGVITLRAAIGNAGTRPYDVQALAPALPLPARATELLDLTGRHLRERIPQRHAFTLGTHVRENRRGRTGADASLLLAAGTSGFANGSGEVWGLHVGWSGNHRVLAERLPDGGAILAGGELLEPGEIRLGPGEEYQTPWLYASYGHGLDDMSNRIHAHLRARPTHPSSPRPVTLNVWEAVYFDHDLERLTELATKAAAIGVERYVLDDGWFRHRRNDTAGLGDWFVDEGVWPAGLHPLVDHVRSLGMQFGIWVEPEMINPDSDTARAHPEWILHTGDRLPPPSRHQQALDLTNPDAYSFIAERLGALLDEYDISYFKWDHNRDIFDAGRPPTGTPAIHAQTLAAYRLIDELKAAHPGLEIESCSSGGGRVDLGILARTDRVWGSDCIDAIERQQIQRWTELLIPPELIGAHVGSPTNHATGRRLDLELRAAIALTGHFGIEWDIASATEAELAELAAWIDVYRRHRPLLHSGRVVHGDHPDPAIAVRGVVALDGSEALYWLTQLTTTLCSPPGMAQLPGLTPEAVYRVALLAPGDAIGGQAGYTDLSWADGVQLTGRTLGVAGLQLPALWPGRCVLIHLTADN